eukprot:TRINITY_DN3354_c0_g1_i1.p1 TRINITY_DN3354_c0_g1~~TRINITY_DN3354_c0_g1_i1.p1  ORF type:complete len:292 (-),score=127.23 TRINITY_DN3354_c0_g1_i1:130-1005(-)
MVATTERKRGGWRDLRNGAILQTIEALTLGLPLEVWKTRMGRYRSERNFESLLNIYRKGILNFWAGATPKAIEAATKGAVLLYSKELFDSFFLKYGMNQTTSALLAGAGGGICQTIVIGPCTYLVTSAVTSSNSNLFEQVANTWKAKGISGFYAGGVAVAYRQATNWASREGFTVGARQLLRNLIYADPNAKLTLPQEFLATVVGGTLACWNHPFEVVRIEMQATGYQAATNQKLQEQQKKLGMIDTFKHIYKERGYTGFFRGIFPRILLSVYQTLFMVTIARIIRERKLL